MRRRCKVSGDAMRGVAVTILVTVATACAQTVPYERTFPQPKPTIEKAIKAMRATLSGRLPALEGFARVGEHPLSQYRRGYYQAMIEVNDVPSGGSVVRVSAKVTAWYTDSGSAPSGYQLLVSNGRLEQDLLDQLADQLASQPMKPERRNAVNSAPADAVLGPAKSPPEPAGVAPSPPFPSQASQPLSSSLSHGIATPSHAEEQAVERAADQKANRSLQTEADGLEEVLRKMAHPNNLVAVKKSGTPVVASPSLTAKSEFLASMHDEFELLDFNADWVHVRISGLSRGWIWRNNVDMPDGIADTGDRPAAAQTAAADLFHVTREETAVFPGDWEPLRSRKVRIVSVQKVEGAVKDAAPSVRLEYAKFLLEKNFNEIEQQGLPGIVLIFDSADGGMIAATSAALQQWKTGALTDAALWHQCFFDPPETFDSSATSGSR